MITIPVGDIVRQYPITIPVSVATPQSTKTNHRVMLEIDEDGRFVAKCVTLQGVVTDGASENEALSNVVKAITACLEAKGKTKEFNLIVDSD